MISPNKVITEFELQQTIWEQAQKSKKMYVAVGYCGENAEIFFPERSRPPIIKCIVDMSSKTVSRGLTNPKGVAKLCQIGTVKSLRDLHSKVVIFDDAAIVGSANFSTNSIGNQYQCSIFTTDKKTIKELLNWFEDLWDKGNEITQEYCIKMIKIFPKNIKFDKNKTTHTKIKIWKKPIYSLKSSDFKISSNTKKKIKKALEQFKNNQCGYIGKDEEEISCFKSSKRDEKYHRDYSKQFHKLLKRINKWKLKDKEELFELAHINGGKDAIIHKPKFLKYPIKKVKEAMKYLFLSNEAEPLRRFEEVVNVNGHYKLPGMKESGISFLMYLWNPRKYAIWNDSVDKGLKKLNIKLPRPFSKHLAQGYQDRIEVLKKIGKLIHLKSFKMIDHFVDALGKNHIKV
jgi:hypothetical protein